MNELKKTLIFVGAAVLLGVVALATAPTRTTPDAFLDRGEPFFPDLEDPNSATTLEVIEFSEQTATARPFKVTNLDGRWTIPSHHDYPADGEERLAKTAAGVIGITKDDFRSDNVADHEACGVLDPLDDTLASLTGRGKRVTLKSDSDVLADFIVGREVEGRPGWRFVRIPGQKRVYVAKMDIDISSNFADWIEQDLLKLEQGSIDQVVLQDYTINERTLRLDQRDVVTLEKKEGEWRIDRTATDKALDTAKVTTLLGDLDQLSIVGVRPKPAGIAGSLRTDDQSSITQADLRSLQNKGYYLAADGRLVSNEGELQVRTDDGILYTLRFGEVLFGSGEVVSAGGAGEDETTDESGPGENRYLFITVDLDRSLFPEPPRPSNTDFENKAEAEWSDEDRTNKQLHDAHVAWERDVASSEQRANELRDRFANWYYVISSASFDKVRLSRADLVKDKPADS